MFAKSLFYLMSIMIMLFLAAFDKKKPTKAQGIKLMMIEDGKDNEGGED